MVQHVWRNEPRSDADELISYRMAVIGILSGVIIMGCWLWATGLPLWAVCLFLVSAFIAFATGSSWGTFAIMLPLAVPLAASFNAEAIVVSLPLVVSAVLGGGVFGDHCSPISDTSVISSMAAASDHIDHVRTQLPYALVAGTVAFTLYLVVGIVA